jgi:serine protease
MNRAKPTIALVAAVIVTAALPLPASAAAERDRSRAAAGAYVPDEVVVGYRSGGTRVVDVPPDDTLAATTRRLRARDGVAYAQRNWIAHASQPPYDRGSSGEPGGWRDDQWSLLGRPGGIRVEPAWQRLAKASGGAGATSTTVAVVDTGIAYAAEPTSGVGAAPDFDPAQFVAGYDFVDDDQTPFDANGHGTYVAATIAEQVTFGSPSASDDYLTGIAFGARLMPVRVLDKRGAGSADDVAAGIEWASRSGADIINLSLQFDPAVRGCAQVPGVCKAVRRAKKRGAVVVAAAGNSANGTGQRRALFPGAAPKVVAVGSTTEHGCLARYSHYGKRTDLLAPGGGQPRKGATREECVTDGRPIMQLSFACFPLCGDRLGGFGIRPDLGTSMSAAHVSGVAALVRSTGTVGLDPRPARLARQVICAARKAKPKRFHRPGLLDAAKAVRKRQRC